MHLLECDYCCQLIFFQVNLLTPYMEFLRIVAERLSMSLRSSLDAIYIIIKFKVGHNFTSQVWFSCHFLRLGFSKVFSFSFRGRCPLTPRRDFAPAPHLEAYTVAPRPKKNLSLCHDISIPCLIVELYKLIYLAK